MGQNIFLSQVTRAHSDNLKCLVSSDQQSKLKLISYNDWKQKKQ